MIVSVRASAAQVVLSIVTCRGMGPAYVPLEQTGLEGSADAHHPRPRLRRRHRRGRPGARRGAPGVRRTPGDEDARRAVLDRLQDVRLLVPVVALLGEVEVDDQGLAHDKTSDMAAVLMTGRDGRKALLAFTGKAALQAWDPRRARFPVTTSTPPRPHSRTRRPRSSSTSPAR